MVISGMHTGTSRLKNAPSL